MNNKKLRLTVPSFLPIIIFTYERATTNIGGLRKIPVIKKHFTNNHFKNGFDLFHKIESFDKIWIDLHHFF
ncbi:hypothetical protein RCL_jg14682.t1 [Rhizophagus clarus]|uniref:Uncharacterized protein n=1 Tax=Rhizophagus clarus TaxID=94130 RepID=A0A8H3QYZ8_9GLOM|nr:hypothetical protein RCL_jg14682.t1 [Rhizophagus clarus]